MVVRTLVRRLAGWNVVVTGTRGPPSTLLGPEATGRLVSRLLVPCGSCGCGDGCRVFLEDTGHWVVRRPAGVPVVVCTDCLGGFVRCLRTA